MSDPPKRDIRNHVLFEVATEVANRVGGIYSVLKSKAQVTTAEYGSKYTLLGPLNRASAAMEVEEIEPKDPAIVATIKSMGERGIQTLYGRWLIDGAPRVLLFDTGTAYYKLDEWKADLWSTAGIPSPPTTTRPTRLSSSATSWHGSSASTSTTRRSGR